MTIAKTSSASHTLGTFPKGEGTSPETSSLLLWRSWREAPDEVTSRIRFEVA